MDTLTCPHCGKIVEISQALKHHLEKGILAEQEKDLEKKKKEIEERTEKRIREELDIKLKDKDNEAEEIRKRNEKLIQDLLKSNEEARSLKQKDQEREIEMQKKLLLERQKLQEEIAKTEKEKSSLEVLEIRKQLDDTKKALEEAQRKAHQKSQQMQGEIVELELEHLLRSSFPSDEIIPINKGVSGADVRQIVKSPKGFICGIILWESKQTKDWSDKWIPKLKDDLRNEKAHFPVIVSTALPKEAESGFGILESVMVCSYSLVLPIASLLRKNLLDIGYQKAIQANRGEKAELLYTYITSHEFQQQIENIVEAYAEIKDQIVKERGAFERIWKQREAQAQRIIISTANIIGDMQGKAGASMPAIKGLELTQLTSGE